MQVRMQWHGIVAIDKPAGCTSRQVVDRVAKLVRPAKVGHAGTLDPLATGVLLVAIGPATRLISHLQQGRKSYAAQFRLGYRSDTDDIEGRISQGGDWSGVTASMLTEAAAKFEGTISQVPPRFSAIHIGGERAYARARRGETLLIPARSVEVHALRLTRFQAPDFELQIECGSGTYVRSIGRDMGEELGCGALMTSLRRLAVGLFNLENCLPLDDLDEISLKGALAPPLAAVAHLPQRTVDEAEIRALRQGRSIPINADLGVAPGGEVAVIDADDVLIAVAGAVATGQLQPRIVFPDQ